MKYRWAIAIVVTGCGRLHFEQAGVDDASLDAAIDVPPGAVVRVFGETPRADVANVTADTALIQLSPTTNVGGSTVLEVDDGRVSLIRFDLSEIPTTATLISAHLSISTLNNPTSDLVEVFEIREQWIEGDGAEPPIMGPANFDDRLAGIKWSGSGATGASRGGRIGAMSPNLANSRFTSRLNDTIVANWIAQPQANQGMVLDGTGGDSLLLASSESMGNGQPELIITYLP